MGRKARRLRESWVKKGEAEEEGEGKRRFHKEDIVAIDQLIRFTKRAFQISPTIGRVKYLEWKGGSLTQCL